MKLLAAFLLFNVLFPPYVKIRMKAPVSVYVVYDPFVNSWCCTKAGGLISGIAWSIEFHASDVHPESWKNVHSLEDIR